MTQVQSKELSASSIIKALKNIGKKMNWKHAIAMTIAVGIFLYPRPIIKLFMPLVSKISKNHEKVSCKKLIKQIILTSNETISLQNIDKLHFIKGAQPKISQFKVQECKTIQMLKYQRKPRLGSSASAINQLPTQIARFHGQELWKKYRLTRLDDPNIKLILIKSEETVIQRFLLRFYGMDEKQIHKAGSFSINKLHILRLDERVGTYEHLISQFQPFQLGLK